MKWIKNNTVPSKGIICNSNLKRSYPEVDAAIKKGCEWILSNMQEDGRLTTPYITAWRAGRVCTELIHLCCLSPLIEAGKMFGRDEFIFKANKILEYYKASHLDEIKGFGCLLHFFAYILTYVIPDYKGDSDIYDNERWLAKLCS